MNRQTLTFFAAAICMMFMPLATPTVIAQTNLVKPDQWLALQPKPNFAPGHHLPHLTKCGWPLSSNLNIECAKNWGYALDLGDASSNVVAQIAKTNTTESRFVYLASKYPSNYVLSASITRFWPFNIPKGLTIPKDVWVTNTDGLFVDNTGTNTWIDVTNTKYTKVVSPEGPDSFWSNYAEFAVAPLRAIQSIAPIAVLINNGEYGLGVIGFDGKAWKQDPRVLAAMSTNLSWPVYSSIRKAHQLTFLTSAIKRDLPSREVNAFYTIGSEQVRYSQQGMPKWEDTQAWGWSSINMISNADLSVFENYYTPDNPWTNVPNAKWNQIRDLLTRDLNGVGYHLKLGKSLSYNYVCGGWGTNASRLSDIPRYMGFLKCLYTAGMVGGIAGYFDYPVGGFDVAFPTNAPPHWLLQIQALSHVHAQFSKLENFLFNGDLLPGPTNNALSIDQPAYEFPTGDSNARVLARKLRSSDQWLITAWAACGDDRNVNVTIPNLGSVQVLARSSGAVYQANQTNLMLLDFNGVLPTALSPPANLQIINSQN